MIVEMTHEEVGNVGGGVDARMVATGIAVVAGGILLSECPPAAGAVMSIGVHIIAAGLVSDG